MSQNVKAETPEKKADVQPYEKRNVRMRKGSIIQSVPKSRIDDFKRLGFTEI
jgi:hypothetical protein